MKRKKIGQRIGALILSVALLFSSIPADIYAAEVVPVIQEEQLEESIPAEVPEEKQPEEGAPAEAPEEKQPEEGAPAEAPEEKQPEEGAPAEAPEEKQPEESTPAEVPEEKQPEEGAPAEVPEEKQLEEGTSAEVPEEKQLEEETPADKGKDQTVEADQDSSTAESEALLEADQEEASEKSEQPWEISVTDEEGNTLAVTLDDIEDPEKLINEIDFSQTSGKLVWFKNISVDHEGAIEVEIQVPDQDDLEGKVVKAIHFPEDGELEYIDAETEGDMVSFTLNSLSPVAVYVAEDLYHYAQEDIGSIITWRETYIPNGYEDLLTYPDSWWDSLYDYERDLADFLKGLIVELSDDIYMDQDLDECISILESGIDASTFFEGTLYSGLNLEDLHNLQRFGYSLDDVYEFWMAACGEESESDLFYEYIKQIDADEIDEDLEILAGTVEKIMPVNPMLYVSNGDLVAKMSVSSTGYSGTGHGTIYKLTVGGQPSLCLSMGKSARSTYLYNANPGTYEQKNDGLGYLISRADLSGSYYVCVQIAAWLYMQSSSYSKTQVEQRATAMLNISSEEDLEAMVSTIWNNYYGATQNSKSYYVFHSDNANSQNIGTTEMPATYTYTGGGGGGNEGGGEGGGEYATASVSATAEDSVEVDAKVTVTKHDSITDEVLSGAKIRINGSSYTSGEDGSVTHKEEDEYEASATGPSYTYVVDWGSLDAEQKADADSKGYYHSYDAAYSASWGEANQQVQDELDEWAHDWRCDFSAKETDPPYGYCNNDDNTYDTTCKDGQHKYHDFYNKPWEAWLKVTKHDSITGQTDFSLADADFHVYEYNKETGEYELYRYSDRQLMVDNRDGTYNVGPLYYNPRNEGKFMILETESPFGYTIDQTLNRFYFEITGEEQITYTNGNQYNSAGTYVASQSSPHDFKAYNEPWKVKVDVIKVDENTGELLSGVKFDILRFNRDTNDYDVNFNKTPNYIKVNEQADQTYLSEWVYWNYQNQGKFYLVETTARKGYFSDWKDRIIEIVTGHPAGWQDDDANGKTAYYFQITGSRTEEGVVEGYNSQTTLRASSNNQGTITNERTKGRVTVKKLDTESESQIVQGDTTLDGAVYELRAAADITHADGHTGVIYKKGDLVMTGTVGKTPVTDKNGYVLNTAGKRYITYGGEIQYKDTPGEFSFYNIELGKYTLKEVKASEGYMLDETTYNLTFTYDDETQRVILRDETSSADKNTLTMDNQDKGNEIIYTGEHVQKKAFSMVKTSDNQFQTELVPVAGAGFSVYLVSELAGVRNGSIAPVNGTSWSGADILNFYDYDFTQDKTATVYKRSLEAWTAYDRMWLQAVSGGNANEYRVKEMFTDSNGALTSPELPYGTYVVVETTTPEKHVMARPFFVYVTDDGGVVYTDATRQTIKESFSEKKDIRFGDHNNSKVYKDPSAYNANAIEGRVPQALRYISDNRTESYLRLVKADSAFLPSDGTILKPEEMVAGTVLKEGSSYRIKIVNMSDREYETFLSTGWKKDADGYIWYYETSSRKEYGTAACPFDPTVLRNGEGKIIDCYLTLPAKLPTGSYEITELHAPSGYVLNGEEDTLEDTSIERLNTYQVTDTPADPIQFVIDNNSVYPDGQMGENKYTLTDSYGNVTCTVFQDNKEQKGILELTKHGEKLYGASDQDGTALKDKIDNVYFRQIWNNAAYTTKDQIFEYKDAPIEGAVFDIYAAEDIYTQELDASMLEEYGVDVSEYLVWSKDDKISTITTDKTGYAYLADLYIGKYYIKEVTAGDGFVLNEEIQEFEITAQEEHVNFEWVSSDYENQRQKIYLEAEKQDVETHEPLPGAIYGLYNKNDIYSYIMDNPDKTVPDYRHVQKIFDYINIDDGRLLIPADTLIATAVTDETGIAVFDEDLPLGEYYINELEAPLGYTTSDIVTDVDATYAGSYGSQDVETQDHTDILYENQKTKNVFTKSDIVSGVNIDGAYLEIWEILVDEQGNILKNPDGSYKLADEAVDAWVSQYDGEDLHYYYEKDGFYFEIGAPDELPEGEDLITKEGHLIENLIVGKQYLLRETLAPENYVGYEASYDETKEANKDVNEITEEVMFIVTNDNIVAEHDMKDQRTVGTFSVTKEGEFFVGTEKDLKFTDKVKNLFMTVFNYLFGRVENAVFEIYVRDDIFTPDKTGDLAEWTNAAGDTLQLTKDTLIETITTSDHGIATIENLPLGTYYIKEVGAGDGDFLLNPDIKDVTLSYVDQDTPVVFATDTPYVNDRQKVEITMEKKRINDEGKKETVQGAVFGLYAEEALYGYVISGEKVVTPYNDPYVLQDQLLETIESDGEGKAVFQADLPCGKYYVKEIQPADGYLKNPKTYHFDASYTGQEGDKVLTFAQEVINTITEVYIDKQDITNDKEISGAHLQVIEKDSEEIIDSWTSDGKSHEIEGLKLSDDEENVYILRETLPADGFVTANDIEFKLYQDKDPEGNWLQTHSVQVLDVEEEEHQEGTVISQAAFSDQQDIMADSVKGNVIANWIFKDGVLDITFTGNATQAAIDKTLREKDFADMEIRKVVFHNGSAEGFYPDKVVPGKPMEIASTSKWVTVDKNTVIMKDDITKIRISKYDITSSDEVLGAKLQIIDQDGNVVEEWISGEEPHYIERLPVGDYTLREIQAPTENGYVHTEDLKFRVDDTGNIQSVYLPDNYTKLQIKKTDIATGEPVIGAELQIVQIIKNPDGTESEKVLESWITTEEDHYSDRLPVGDYYLVETKAPIEDGYVTAERIRFTVEEDYHIKLVEMKDDYTRVRVYKTDKNLQMLMEGAVLELYALSEKEDKLVASWTSSSSEGYYIERLPVGTYKIVETSAPEGYKIAEPFIFEVKDTVGVQVVVFENEMIADFVKLVVEKSTIEKTQVNDTFKYTIDTIHNASAVLMDEFTVTDTLPVEVRLTELYTGTYNEDYLFDVLYRTNKEPEWKVWESGLSTLNNNKLLVADIPLEDEEYVTEFRMAFGTVRSQFKNVETPEYLVKVVDWGDGELINDIVLTGVKYGVTHSDKDQTVTTLYKKDISGKKPHGGSHPKYEITGSEMDENTLLKLQYPWLANSPQTGDMAPVAPLAALCIVALAGIGIYIWRKMKK